jgi:hypothetical protein
VNVVTLAGAVGGQGTTLIATTIAALAARHRPTALFATRPQDVRAIAGIGPLSGEQHMALELAPGLTLCGGHAPAGPARNPRDGLTIVDGGRADQAPLGPENEPVRLRWLVLRGPCYLALRAALEAPWKADGVILVSEPGRALRAADVADVLGIPILAEVPFDPVVARAVDAGVLLDRVGRLPSLRPLAVLARRCWPPNPEPANDDDCQPTNNQALPTTNPNEDQPTHVSTQPETTQANSQRQSINRRTDEPLNEPHRLCSFRILRKLPCAGAVVGRRGTRVVADLPEPRLEVPGPQLEASGELPAVDQQRFAARHPADHVHRQRRSQLRPLAHGPAAARDVG